jgi:ketosteroid isomerase-like protein
VDHENQEEVAAEDPVAIIKRAFEAFANRDVETLTELSHPDITLNSVTGILAGREDAYRGIGALGQYLADVDQVWESLELIPEEFRDLKDGRVLVMGRVKATRKDPEARIDSPNAWTFELADDRIVKMTIYAEPTSDASWLFK